MSTIYLLESKLKVFDVLLESTGFLFQFLLVLEELVAGIFLLLQTLLGVLFIEPNVKMIVINNCKAWRKLDENKQNEGSGNMTKQTVPDRMHTQD